jgi:hypothetical protein
MAYGSTEEMNMEGGGKDMNSHKYAVISISTLHFMK